MTTSYRKSQHPFPDRASSFLRWKPCGRTAWTECLQPYSGSGDMQAAALAHEHQHPVQHCAEGKSGHEGVCKGLNKCLGQMGLRAILLTLLTKYWAPAQYLLRGNWVCWMCSGELCKEQGEIQMPTLGWWPAIAAFPRWKHLQRAFPTVRHCYECYEILLFGKKKETKAQLWCATGAGIALEV